MSDTAELQRVFSPLMIDKAADGDGVLSYFRSMFGTTARTAAPRGTVDVDEVLQGRRVFNPMNARYVGDDMQLPAHAGEVQWLAKVINCVVMMICSCWCCCQ